MKLETVKMKLKEARAKQREIRTEIDRLRQIIRDVGEDPDAPEVDLTARNKRFYIQWKDGQSFAEIAREYKLSTTTVSTVCHRIDKILEHRRFHFQKYKDLLKYK
jgi:DNA-binding CsgD family transcriptional regulator